MTSEFQTQIDKFVVDTEEKLLDVTRYAIDRTVKEAQEPRGKGGNMPVITGFLRASGKPSLNALPNGPTKGDPEGSYTWAGQEVNLTLTQLKPGDTFYFGWTAVYANRMEVKYGFLESAVMNWQNKINEAVSRLRGK